MRVIVHVIVRVVVGMIVPVCVIKSIVMVAISVFSVMRVRAETHFGVYLRWLMRVIVRVPRGRDDALQLQHQFPLRP
jgi:hypothetical protein